MFLNHLSSYFFFTMSRQTVHNHSIRLGNGHNFIVNLIAFKSFSSLFCFRFLTHRCPYISNKNISIFAGFSRRVSKIKAIIF